MGCAPCPTHPAVSERATAFLRKEGWADAARKPLAADFSARRYTRLVRGNDCALLMEMPEPQALLPFVHMQKILAQCSARVPALYAVDETSGLALLEDLGDASFDKLLQDQSQEETLYRRAVDVLLTLHKAVPAPDSVSLHLPLFDAARFLEQVGLFLDVYGPVICGHSFSDKARAAFAAAWQTPLKAAAQGPQGLLLRDYHPANIMQTPDGQTAVIDFQDGGIGPIAYDLASLLEDARRDVPAFIQNGMMAYYLQKNPVDAALFCRSYAILATQRHMRVLAILARRWRVDGVAEAEVFLDRTKKLFLNHKSEPLLAPVYQWFAEEVGA